ncbi:Nif3-like dinuclear metal center hexameric protein [Croceivirga thetidis]|uniref:GTP cyclohydrolase 1 type 2 homolog n=1 Tax=Croceivirga thetidis TaxID=2721623 RepID=A0ABX1GTQ5_9FLAO|nr:Nif3-like dinuclear metal center hexameric protein [Croceivirga thetidis]NKI33335.1 Nif3-like dinuclear metal center hexameric protein [Croceivirga thetidis]
MKIKSVCTLLNELAPLHYAEDFDNVGLLVGNSNDELKGILVTLDTLEDVVEEAISKGCNLIVSFHPIIFKGLKKLTGSNYVERVVQKAIKNDIAIYSIHTALDNSHLGVSAKICQVLGLKNQKVLIPKKGTIKKLVTYVPVEAAKELKNQLFKSGAGAIGNYDNCSFGAVGTGSFKGNEESNPTLGVKGQIHFEQEEQLHITFEASKEKKVLSALFEHHPYEEVAYELTTLENTNQKIGMGMFGVLGSELSEKEFLNLVKDKFGIQSIRHSKLLGKPIKKVAVLGGSGAFAIGAAKAIGADIFLTADLKYHNFFEAENRLVLADIGHFESEQFTKNLLVDFLTEKIPNFAVALSESITNPVNYF